MIELVRRILNRPFFYESYHKLIGANYRSRVLVDEYICPQQNDRILDIGCGPGNMLPFLPDCQYVGFDANESYIASAHARVGYTALKPGGRMITNDGCYVSRQSAAKRYLLSRDRGQFVRTQPGYEALARSSFRNVYCHLREDVLRIPYTHLIMVCGR